MTKKIKDLTLEELNIICAKFHNQFCQHCPLKFGYSISCQRTKAMIDRDLELSHFNLEKEIEIDEIQSS